MTTEFTEICNGCRLPAFGGSVLVPMQHGFICTSCVKTSADQMALAMERKRALRRLQDATSHVLDLAKPSGATWCTESEVRHLDILASELFSLASAFASRSGPFADKVVTGQSAVDGLLLAHILADLEDDLEDVEDPKDEASRSPEDIPTRATDSGDPDLGQWLVPDASNHEASPTSGVHWRGQ